MKIKGLKETFNDYKKISLFISTCHCSGKCWKELNMPDFCQNSHLNDFDDIEVSCQEIFDLYKSNKLVEALVIAGREPFDDFDDIYDLISFFRENTNDDIVIYTGFYKHEILQQISKLSNFPNIIIKYGRFIPNDYKVHDKILGVDLASSNQYAERIS